MTGKQQLLEWESMYGFARSVLGVRGQLSWRDDHQYIHPVIRHVSPRYVEGDGS